MRPIKWLTLAALALSAVAVLLLWAPQAGQAAYHHAGEADSDTWLAVYPDNAGTKLDSCTLCHSGGSYVDSKGKTVTLGSCQWCHYAYGYDATGDISRTMNPYGAAFLAAGRSEAAVNAIATLDSDGDGYRNADEIAALRYPGDANDDPTKVTAPYRVYSRAELEAMPQHTQTLLMNAHKSTDFYAQYTGVTFEKLFEGQLLDSATGMMVYAPDGWAQYHPLYPDANPLMYHAFGDYPSVVYHYNTQADVALNPATGWAEYDAPAVAGLANGDAIPNPQGLELMLAFKRDGAYIDPGVLNEQNKLDGEGPFRVVPPQKTPGPPDQRSTVSGGTWVWPFDANADHNAGYSSRSATIIKVAPLPAGTTDIDIMEAGWDYVDEAKIVVYGAIDPVPNALEKLSALKAAAGGVSPAAIKVPNGAATLMQKVAAIEKAVEKGDYTGALEKLREDVMAKTDGCALGDGPDGNDWIVDCDLQRQLYWAAHEIAVYLEIVA